MKASSANPVHDGTVVVKVTSRSRCLSAAGESGSGGGHPGRGPFGLPAVPAPVAARFLSRLRLLWRLSASIANGHAPDGERIFGVTVGPSRRIALQAGIDLTAFAGSRPAWGYNTCARIIEAAQKGPAAAAPICRSAPSPRSQAPFPRRPLPPSRAARLVPHEFDSKVQSRPA